ncbi:hypothetical protein [Geothermobacter hydrogeniphilus]|uniref:Uncharacterized protein n=1 Tax=Geothermobacter hydrogeniphilus TaxID=1969733 RepID=A0A1X0Y5N6_9BACT|nr:hypothetical protein [Geothermobacter hydrogeniphilus]ORJ60439.1 hypothetical protein B5V00_07680 [Geothermobacter hydrogeniphilus]
MIQVKTFGEPLQPFKTRRELEELDARVNAFVVENVARVISVQDMPITENGSVIGMIRTLVYET